MERREVLKTAVAVAGALSASAFAAGQDDHHHHHDHGGAPAHDALITATADCLRTGEACLAHCLQLLADGDKEMAACAQSVNELLAACTALMKLAGQNSRYVPAFAKVVGEVCANCETVCRKHADQHAECKVCADSCAACSKACGQVTA
ncbi:MAG: four-helix bundle copper-binding protein [Gammaproteobacteria bacterium]